ncbi:hypothetical protein JR338_06780 [Chloroflexota bacterium]|nr:hypothetical protein JR338_06780 [Chloroflexota bacterium]
MSQEVPLQSKSTQPAKFPYKRIIKRAWKQAWKNLKFHKYGIGILFLISGVTPAWNPLYLSAVASNLGTPVRYLFDQRGLLINPQVNSFWAFVVVLLIKFCVRSLFTYIGVRSLMSAFRVMNNVFKKEFHYIPLSDPEKNEPYKPQTKKNIQKVWFSLFSISIIITGIVLALQWHLTTITRFYRLLIIGLDLLSVIIILITFFVTIEMYHSEIPFRTAYKKMVGWVSMYIKEMFFTQLLVYLVGFAVSLVLGVIVIILLGVCTAPLSAGGTEGFGALVRVILLFLGLYYVWGIVQSFRFAVNCLTYQQLDKMENPKEEVLPATE